MTLTATPEPARADVVALPWFHGPRPGDFALRRGFTGRLGQVVAEPGDDGRSVRLTVGLGRAETADSAAFRRAAAAAVRQAGPVPALRLDLAWGGPAERARAVAEGAALAAYRYDEHRSSPRSPLTEIIIRTEHGEAVAEAIAITDGVRLARDLVNAPPSHLTPTIFAERMAGLPGDHVTCTVYPADALAALGASALLAVGRGSAEPPCLVELNYTPPGAERLVTLVGKGVTFDSGGLTLKPVDGMRRMKADMGGAAAVAGVMTAAAALGLPTRLRALLPLAENMPGGAAIRIGDVLHHADSTTTEVLNTDNEGRLILADTLLLAQSPTPDHIIDVATLTASAAHALGTRTAALFSPSDALARALLTAAQNAGEPLWRLPLTEQERHHLRSTIADRTNSSHRPGDAIHAALYLKEFTDDTIPWAHLDLGAAAYNEDPPYNETPHGATGFAVRTLLEHLRGQDLQDAR
ncbi:leucyl aminopeptidase family protein [Actinokineospora sp. 24-640]